MRQLIVLILVLFTCPTFVFAQDAAPTIKDVMDADEKTDAVIADSRADEDIRPGDTPLSTVLAIVDAGREGDWQGAGEHLDMRYLPPDMAEADAATLMEQLSIVWGQQRILDLTRLSSDPAGHLDDDLPSYRDKIGTISLVDETMPLYLQRVPGENGRRVWKISNATVQQIPMLWEQFGYNPAITQLANYLPDFTLLYMQNWQVAAVVLMLLGAWIAAALLRRLTLRLLAFSDRYRETLHRFFSVPFRWYVFFKLLQLGVAELGLSIRAQVYLNQAALGYLALVFLVLGIIELKAALFLSNSQNQKYWSGIIRPLRTILKLVAIVVIFLLWLSDSGYDIGTLLAGLGIGSIAVALAAQKTLENVIGAFTLYIAKPVQPGDFCRVGTIVGVIEEIGLRSTRIRQVDRTVVYVPNSVLASANIENISESDFRRYQRNLYVRLGASPDQLRHLLADLRRLIYSHPRLTDRAARVRFEEILRDGYRISINAYVDSSVYDEFLAVSEDLNLRILTILEDNALQLAVPVQQWLQGDSPSTGPSHAEHGAEQSSEKSSEQSTKNSVATAQVLAAFPDFSDEEKQAMKGSLDYPEKGKEA